MSDQESTPRGSIGEQTYQDVRALVDQGRTTSAAIREVAESSGRSAGTVQTAYYRVARSKPGGGGVRLRPRTTGRRPDGATDTEPKAAPAKAARKSSGNRSTPRRSAASSSGQDLDRVVADLHKAVDALAEYVREAQSQQSSITELRSALSRLTF